MRLSHKSRTQGRLFIAVMITSIMRRHRMPMTKGGLSKLWILTSMMRRFCLKLRSQSIRVTWKILVLNLISMSSSSLWWIKRRIKRLIWRQGYWKKLTRLLSIRSRKSLSRHTLRTITPGVFLKGIGRKEVWCIGIIIQWVQGSSLWKRPIRSSAGRTQFSILTRINWTHKLL